MRISVIVPVLDEATILRKFLVDLRQAAPNCELIVVDGGSVDGSFELARDLSDQALQSARGRALQMNAGAKRASGDVLWFIHADSTIPHSAVDAITHALSDPKIIGGSLRLRIDGAHWIYPVRDSIANLLVDLGGAALGDRGLFCRRGVFFEIGGYPDVPLLEDGEFYRALKRRGRVVQLRETIGTSSRRYKKLGPLRTTLFYALIMLLYLARVPVRMLARLVIKPGRNT